MLREVLLDGAVEEGVVLVADDESKFAHDGKILKKPALNGLVLVVSPGFEPELPG